MQYRCCTEQLMHFEMLNCQLWDKGMVGRGEGVRGGRGSRGGSKGGVSHRKDDGEQGLGRTCL